MKNISVILLAMYVILTCSCMNHFYEDFDQIEYGFDTEIQKHSKEVILMKVNNTNSDIKLKGSIELISGTTNIKVIRPDDNVVFSKSINKNVRIVLNEQFIAQEGYWKLKYQSNDGQGFLRLHLSQ